MCAVNKCKSNIEEESSSEGLQFQLLYSQTLRKITTFFPFQVLWSTTEHSPHDVQKMLCRAIFFNCVQLLWILQFSMLQISRVSSILHLEHKYILKKLYLCNFSNPSQIGEKAGLSSTVISFLLLVFGFASLASEPSRGIQKNLSFLKKRRG